MSKKFTDLTALTSADNNDVLAIVDISASATKKVTVQGIVPGMTVYPSNLATGASSSTWAWQTWTPTWGNLTLGNATVTARYQQIGKTIVMEVVFTLGNTSAISNNAYLASLPVSPARAATTGYHLAGGNVVDANGSWYPLWMVYQASLSGYQMLIGTTGGSGITYSGLAATTPFTWTASDMFQFIGTYEAA